MASQLGKEGAIRTTMTTTTSHGRQALRLQILKQQDKMKGYEHGSELANTFGNRMTLMQTGGAPSYRGNSQ